MRKLVMLPLLIMVINGFAQSDNCVTATILNLDAAGSGCATGTTVGATSENIMFGACNAAPAIEVWYTYVASGSQNDFVITPSGLTNSEIVIYTGGCPSTTGNLITCGVVTGTNTLNLSWGFTVGTQVWVGVMSNGGNSGGFDLCVDSYNPPAGGGNACAGAIPLCDKNATTSIPDMSIFTASGAAPSCFPGGGNQDVWLQFTVTQTGLLEWEAAATIGGSGVEWDWTVYNITNGCVGTGNEVEVACNYNYGNESSLAGMIAGAAGNCPESGVSNDPSLEYCDPITVTAGQTYAIQIDNYTNTVATGMDFTFGPGMTAEISPDVDFTITPTTVTCGASVMVTITDNSTGIPDWDFGDGSTFTGNNPPPHNYTTPGTYAITATISGACSDYQTEFVQLFGPVVTVPDTITETCAGDCDGSISLSTSGGSGQYTYLWSPGGETTPSISGQCAGNYSVTVTDAVCGNTTENITLSTGPSCSVPCNMDSITLSQGFCINNTFSVSTEVYFSNAPTTGTMTITIDDG
ncbi:MAG: PKD domain-containing protein, partial [Flavobacteriales bacterium]